MEVTTGRRDRDEDEERRIRRLKERRAPENEVPVPVAFHAVLVATEDLAVFVSGLRVFSNGVELAVDVRARQGLGLDRRALSNSLHEDGRTQLLIGVMLADGRRCSNVGMPLMAAPEDEPTLWPSGGGGGQRSWTESLFLAPLPPPGELRLFCAWPGLGVAETSVLLPADEILAAAGRVRELWPWEPERHEPARSLPEVPEDSWFAPDLRRDTPEDDC
jgi:hypothetical protein